MRLASARTALWSERKLKYEIKAPAAKPTATTHPNLQAATAVSAEPRTSTERIILGIAEEKNLSDAAVLCSDSGGSVGWELMTCRASPPKPHGSFQQNRPPRQRLLPR